MITMTTVRFSDLLNRKVCLEIVYKFKYIFI